MKKILLGCALMLSGTIGFIGTLIAANLNTNSSIIIGALYGFSDHLIAAVFLITALLGIGLSVYEIKNDK